MSFQLPFARPDIGPEEKDAVLRVLDSGWLSSGPEVAKLEQEFAKALGAREAVALHSCTAALHLAAAAWNLGPKDAVIVPAITFTASAEIFSYMGTLPLVLDVDRDSYLLCPQIICDFIAKECSWDSQKEVLLHIPSQRRIRALVPVHLGGRPCEMDGLLALAKEYKLKVLEDAAHAFPSTYKGRSIGSIGDATAFSFYATKNLTTGEGGMLTTNHRVLADQIRKMRLHGIEGQSYERKGWSYDVVCEGYKYNMTDICAAIGRVQLKRTEEMYKKRLAIHKVYEDAFQKLKGIRSSPATPHGSSYHLYTIEILPDLAFGREEFAQRLSSKGIGLSLHFIPLYRFSFYQKKYGLSRQSYPNSESIYKGILSLPIYSAMNIKDAKRVVDAVYETARS